MEVKREFVDASECSVKLECESNSSLSDDVALPSELCVAAKSELSSTGVVDEKDVCLQEGYWGYNPLKYRVDGKQPDGSDFLCAKCEGFCVNPVVVGCNHPSCRECLDSSENKCPRCKLHFNDFEKKYLNKFQGKDYYEFTKLVGKRGRGSATKYYVKWLNGVITREPARNVPALARKRYLQVLKCAKKFRVDKETAEMLVYTKAKFVM